MLMQNLKTPADLRLPQWEFDALVKVLGMLVRGELQHKRSIYAEDGDSKMVFNMLTTGTKTSCGTAACLGGWARILAGKRTPHSSTLERQADLIPGLHDLYFPSGTNCYSEITTDQAAVALRNYLTTGEARWSEALASE